MRIILICIVMTMLAGAAQAQENRQEFNDKYGVLSERNMFLRDRQRPRQPTTRSIQARVETAPETPERRFVLRGIVIEENEFRAYFENTRGNSILRVVPGESIASGRISNIAIDAVEYEADGHRVWIEVGQNLAGVRQAAAAQPPRPVAVAGGEGTSSPTTTPSATGSGTSGTSSELGSIEERMRARRAAQLNRGN